MGSTRGAPAEAAIRQRLRTMLICGLRSNLGEFGIVAA
jgi:hypothetical protein